MKKRKFVTKLILGGVAFAVSAATLVSTTYAWYVQNSQVTATGVSGTVKDKDASSIFISRDFNGPANLATADFAAKDNAANWGFSVDFTGNILNAAGTGGDAAKFIRANEDGLSTAKGASQVFDGSLEPITWNGTTFVYPSAQTTRTGQATEQLASSYNITVTAANRVIEFDVFVKSTVDDVVLTPYIILKNTTDVNGGVAGQQFKEQTVYTAISYNSSTLAQGSSFFVDAVQAMRMEVDVNYYKLTADKYNWTQVTANTSSGIYDLLKVAKGSYNENGANEAERYPAYQIVTGSKDETLFGSKDYKVPTKDTTKDNGKTYYKRTVSPAGVVSFPAQVPTTDNPSTEGLYEEVSLKGAHAYYMDLVGKSPAAGFVESAYGTAGHPELTNRLAAGNIVSTKLDEAAGTIYKFTFKLWLEGTDPACFDSCEGQKFDISVNFDGNNVNGTPAA